MSDKKTNNQDDLIYFSDENARARTKQEEVKCFITSEKTTDLQSIIPPFCIKAMGITHPDGNYFYERRLKNEFLLEYVIDGKGYVVKNKTKQVIEKCDAFVFQPDFKYKCYSDKQFPLKKVWICFSSEVFINVLKAYSLYGVTVFKNANVKEFFDKLLSLGEKYSCSEDFSTKAGEILLELLSFLYVSRIEKPQLPHAVERLKSRLDNAVYGKITIEEVANELNLSKAQLIKDFKKYFQVTPYNYLLSAKIQAAKRLLSLTDMSVRDVSNSLRFADEHYFSNVFKKKTNLTPLQYRKQFCD